MNLSDQLARLETAQLVRRAPDGDVAFSFKHVLTQEAAYQSLLISQRRDLHRRVAEAFQALYGDCCLDDYAAVLARHYGQAGNQEQALYYATRAGDAAARTYSHSEAIALYTQAIEIAGPRTGNTAALIHLYTRRGRAFELAADYPRALENYTEMQSLAQTRGDRALELEAMILRTTALAVSLGVPDWDEAQAVSADALALARELGDRAAQARIYWNMLLIHRFGNEGPSKAIEYGERSLVLARELHLKEQVALTLKDLIAAYADAGRPHSVRDNLPETEALWRELDNKPMLAETLGGVAVAHLVAGDLARAVRAGEEALALNRSIDNRYGLAVVESILFYPYRELGQLDRAIEVGEHSLALADELGFVGLDRAVGSELADTLAFLGAWARAEERVERVRAAIAPLPITRPYGYPDAVWARLQLRRANRAAAQQILVPFPLPAWEPSDASSSPSAPCTIASAYVEVALARGQADQANAIADDLIAFVARMEMFFLMPSAQHLKALALRKLKRANEAYALLTEAWEQANAMQLRYRLVPILLTLLEMEIERGDAVQIQRVRFQVREMIEYIAGHTPLPFQAPFLDLPEIRAAMAP